MPSGNGFEWCGNHQVPISSILLRKRGVHLMYVAPPNTENQRQMLTELMQDLEASKLIPHTGEQ